MADIKPQAVKDSSSSPTAAAQHQVKSVKGDKDADGLLDVFTAVEVGENAISKLSKDLSDVSVYALLEQTQQLAMQIKFGARGICF